MKILVTGADGFIGSHLVEYLLDQGHDVRALCYYNSFNSWGWLEGNHSEKLEVISGDIRDLHFCHNLCEGMEMVFHLAALIAIPYSYHSPQSYIDTNVTGSSNVIQAAHKAGAKRIVHTSTSEVYGTAQYVPINEDHPKQPQSPYSASKIGADAMALSYYNAFDAPVVIARPFNTYGPRQSARAIIPTIISQLASGKKEVKLGDLRPTRDLNFVKDTCHGLYKIATAEGVEGESINIGSNFEVTMKELFDTIAELMGVEAKVVTDEVRLRPEKSEVFRLWCDNSKIRELTGFEPVFGLRKGLMETIEWFKKEENLSKYKSGVYNI